MKLPNLYPSDEPHRYDDWLNSNKGTKIKLSQDFSEPSLEFNRDDLAVVWIDSHPDVGTPAGW